MNINQFIDEFDNFSLERKRRFLTKLFSQIIDNPNDHEELLLQWLLPVLSDAEADDYFGTEGFDG